jgi:hypothetical protein
MITELYAVSETVTTTEWSLTTDTAGPDADTTDGVIQLFLDVAALAAGDQYEIKLYEKVQSAGTQRLVETWILDGAQSKPCWTSPAFILMHGWDFTIKKLAGTDRAITASVRQVA